MTFALVSFDENTHLLLSTIAASKSSQIFAYVSDSDREKLPCLANLTIRSLADWRSAVNEPNLDGMVVGGMPADSEMLRFFAQNGVAVIVSHPASDMVDGFQLQMIQNDSESAIQPYFSGINHSLFQVVEGWHNGRLPSPIGPLKQILCYRQASDTSKPTVLRSLAQDVYLVRRIVGRIDRVNAIGIKSPSQSDWSALSVQMLGNHDTVVRWVQLPAGAGQPNRIELIGETGAATALLEGPPSTWDLRLTGTQPQAVPLPAWEGPTATINRLVQAARFGDKSALQAIADDWENACRAVEVVESVEQSCRRGKTIELYHEQHTEEATFKSLMAAGGCLMLLVVLMVMIGLQAVATVYPEIQNWPVWSIFWKLVFLIMFGFLGLQLLRFVFAGANSRGE